MHSETCVEPETGHVNLKKREAWINTFTPLLTYLMRCNTDVTSLHSGTAIKAVLIYVSDYITKPALKTHVFFDVIKGVFQHNKEYMQTGKTETDHAQKLMTQMVNVLGAKMEIGAPMICSYLLGLPDHYTNQTFTTFYWKSFVSEVKNDWLHGSDNPEEVKVQLKKRENIVIGVSPVEDYIHCSLELESMSLYQWICRCYRVADKGSNVTFPHNEEPPIDSVIEELENNGDDCDSHNEYDITEVDDDQGSLNDFIEDDDNEYDLTLVNKEDNYSPISLGDQSLHNKINTYITQTQSTVMQPDVDLNETDKKKKPGRCSKLIKLRFMDVHPLYDTHHTVLQSEAEKTVPNFVGGLLPCRDIGDHEYYCTTMLTLFKPWHHGKDLKAVDITWDTAFTNFHILPWQQKIIDNFNLRYECMDARDDYNAQLRQGGEQHHALHTDWTVLDQDSNITITNDEIETGILSDCSHEALQVGSAHFKCMQKISKITCMMGESGCKWAEPVDNLADTTNIDTTTIIRHQSASEWKNEVGTL